MSRHCSGDTHIASRTSLSLRLFILVLVAMLPLAAILFFNLFSIKAAKEAEVHAEALRTGQLAALEIQRVLSGLQDTLIAISAAPAVETFDVQGCTHYLARLAKELPQFAGIAVLDRQGLVRCREKQGGIGLSLADRAYVKEALGGEFSVGDYSVGRISSAKVLPVAVPIGDDASRITGVVAGSLNLDWLNQKIEERSFPENGNVTIADRNGVILARHPDPKRFVGSVIPDAYLHLVKASEPGTLELTSQDGTRRILAYFPPSDGQRGLYVSAGLSTAEEFQAVTRATYYGIGVTLIGGLGALILAGLTARYSIQAPVERLLRTVEAWRNQDEGARTGMTAGGEEFGRLGAAIDAYMDELVAARFQRRRDEEQRDLLMRELDHRVKNLLAMVQSVARQTFRAVGVDHATLEAFDKRLAAIADAHALLMSGNQRSALLRQLVAIAIRPFDTGENSQFDIDGVDITLDSKAALALGMALHELCTNAVKYGGLSVESGRVMIRWQVADVGGVPHLVLEWTESGGPPVKPPENRGFGTTLIERMLGRQIEGDVRTLYNPEGLHFRLAVPAAAVTLDP